MTSHWTLRSVLLAMGCMSGFCTINVAAAPETNDLFELPLENLSELTVITTSRVAQKVFDAPGIVTVITAEQIAGFGANNLAEVVERLPGVSVLNGYVFKNNAMSIRGDLPNQNDTHLLVLINGRPFLYSFSGGGNGMIFDALPVQSIERLEFVRGPGSVLYGSNAYSGVLNIITRKPDDDSRGMELTGGSFGTRSGALYGSFQQGDFGLRTTVQGLNEDGWRAEMVDELGVNSSADFGEKNRALMSSATWRDFSADLMLLDTNQEHYGPVPRWPSQRIDRTSYFFSIGHHHRLNSNWDLNSSLGYSTSTQNYPQANPFNLPWEFDAETAETRAGLYATGRVYEDHKLLVGGSITRLTGDLGGGQVTLSEYDLIWSNLYAQFDYRWNEQLNLFLGGQWNKAENVAGEFVPRFGLIYRINPNMGIKALYSEAFRSPYPAETDVQALPILVGNPDLRPELVETYDLQWFYDRGDYQLSATYFNTRQKDLIDRIAGGPGVPGTFSNIGERDIQGMELEWHARPTRQWEWLGSVLYQWNEDDMGVEDVTLAPDYLVKFGVLYHANPGFSLGLFDIYTDDYQDTRITKPNSAPVNPAAGGNHLLSLNASFNLRHWFKDSTWNKTRLSLYGNNLLDEGIYVPEYSRDFINTLPAQGGRSWFLKLDVGF